MRSPEVFPRQENYGFPLVDDDLVSVLSLQLIEELDKLAVSVLAKVLDAHVRQLILVLERENADISLLHRLLCENILQRDVLCVITEGVAAGDVQRRCIVDVEWHAAKALIKTQLQRHTPFLIVRAAATSSASIMDCAVSPYTLTLKLIGELAGITI